MKRRASLIAAGVIAAALLGGAAVLMAPAKSVAPAAGDQPPAIEISAGDLHEVRYSEWRHSISLTGTLQPRNWTTIKAKASGELREIMVREGEAVRAGQVVARIDSVEAQARLREKLADLEGAKAQLALTEKTRANQQALLKQNFISQNAYDAADSNYLVASAKLLALEAQAAIARKSLEDTTVRAPIAGIVSQRLAQPGEKVAIDARILALVDLSELEVEALIPASDIARVRPGQEIEFRIEGYGSRIFTGRIARINPSTQSGTRSFLIYALLPNRDGALRGGLFAKGSITTDKRAGTIVVPDTALFQDGAQLRVWRLDGNRLTSVPVTPGMRNDDQGLVELLAGLTPGDRIVKTQLGGLHAGATVTISPLRPEAGRPMPPGDGQELARPRPPLSGG